MRAPSRFWKNFPEGNFEDCDLSDWLAVLPLGAHEQHGPHLPFETDALIASGIAGRLDEALCANDEITFLPTEPVGYSPEHLDYPGSKSLGFNEALERWISVGEKLHGIGFRKLLLLNAHGGNSPLMTIVATELRLRFSMLVVGTSWTRFGAPDNLISKDELAYGIHGGDMETSVMLALHPDKVYMARAENFNNFQQEMTRNNTYLRAYGKHAFGWKMQDLNPHGVVGNAADASAEKGEMLIDHAVKGLQTLIDEMQNFDMENLKEAVAAVDIQKDRK